MYKKIFLERLDVKADAIDEQIAHLEEERHGYDYKSRLLNGYPR